MDRCATLLPTFCCVEPNYIPVANYKSDLEMVSFGIQEDEQNMDSWKHQTQRLSQGIMNLCTSSVYIAWEGPPHLWTPTASGVCGCMCVCVCVCAHTHTCAPSVVQLCPTLCDAMDCSPTRILYPWNFPGKHVEAGCHFLLQGIFLIQGSNLYLLSFLSWQVNFFYHCATWKAPP